MRTLKHLAARNMWLTDEIVREIGDIITTLTTGTPQEQEDTLNTYFLRNASFTHPFCRVPSFSIKSIPIVGGIDSLAIILAIYRWYRTLSPKIDINVDSAGEFLYFRPPPAVFRGKRHLPTRRTAKANGLTSQYLTNAPAASSSQSARPSPYGSSRSTGPQSASPPSCSSPSGPHGTQTRQSHGAPSPKAVSPLHSPDPARSVRGTSSPARRTCTRSTTSCNSCFPGWGPCCGPSGSCRARSCV